MLGAIYVDTNGDFKAYIAILRRFGVLEWVETALKNNVQIRHPKEEVGRLAGNKKLRYQYSVAVKYVKEDIARLQKKVANIEDVIEGLKRLLERREKASLSATRGLTDSLRDCQLQLQDLASSSKCRPWRSSVS